MAKYALQAATLNVGFVLMLGIALPGTHVRAVENAPATQPSTQAAIAPAPGDWKGKRITLKFQFDLDEDGLPTPEETNYLIQRLEAAGAIINTWGDFNAKTDLLVIGRLPPPQRPAGDDAQDVLTVARYEQSTIAYNEFEKTVADLKTKAAAMSVRVVTAGEVPAIFKLGRPTLAQIRATGLSSLTHRIERRLPDLNFNGNGASDVIDFLNDVTGLQIGLDRRALKEANISLDAPITIRLRDITVYTAFEMVADQIGADKVAFVTDGASVKLTTLKQADQLRKAEPGVWKSLTEWQLAGSPEENLAITAQLKRHLPKIRLNEVAVWDVLAFIQDVSGINLYANSEDLDAIKLDRSTPVTLIRDDAAVDQVLVTISRDAFGGKLVFYCERGSIIRLAPREKAEAAVKADKTSFLLPVKD